MEPDPVKKRQDHRIQKRRGGVRRLTDIENQPLPRGQIHRIPKGNVGIVVLIEQGRGEMVSDAECHYRDGGTSEARSIVNQSGRTPFGGHRDADLAGVAPSKLSIGSDIFQMKLRASERA